MRIYYLISDTLKILRAKKQATREAGKDEHTATTATVWTDHSRLCVMKLTAAILQLLVAEEELGNLRPESRTY